MPLYKQSTKESLIQKLGHDREIFTRKSSQSFMTFLLENVHFLSRKLRVIVVKTQLFVNFYFIHHQGSVASYCFTPTFFYSVMQLVQGHQITSNTDKCPPDIVPSWNEYTVYMLERHQLNTPYFQNTLHILRLSLLHATAFLYLPLYHAYTHNMECLPNHSHSQEI